jgi:hypothetical protein
MENIENVEDVKAENIQASEAQPEQKEITELPYSYILEGMYNNAKVLGQIVFIDKNTDLSNSISVIRMLSNGEKQFFKITVEETKELTIKK